MQSLSLVYPLFNRVILEFFYEIAGISYIYYDNINSEIVKSSALHIDKSEPLNKEFNESSSIMVKIYKNLFDPHNKPISIIKPFPIVKEAYVKASPITTENNNSNSFLSGSISEELGGYKLKKVRFNLGNDSGDESSSYSSSSSSYNTMIIDLKVLKVIDQNNKQLLILKDSNDPSSENLIRILKNTDQIKLSHDKIHVQENNCKNVKFLSYDTQIYKSNKEIKSIKALDKTYGIHGTENNSITDVSLNINSEAVSRINNNTLIIESYNCNIVPSKQESSFASSSDSLFSENCKIKIPVPLHLETIKVFTECDFITPQKCTQCNYMN